MLCLVAAQLVARSAQPDVPPAGPLPSSRRAAPCAACTPPYSHPPPPFCRSSILCHALAGRDSQLWEATLLADVVCTGASSLCLLLFQVTGLLRLLVLCCRRRHRRRCRRRCCRCR